MHVLWTPSWYPSETMPLDGHFFAEAVEVLRSNGLQVGVYSLAARSFWQKTKKYEPEDISSQVISETVKTVPKGAVPGDDLLIKRRALAAAKQYTLQFGKPDVIHAQSVFPGVIVAETLSNYWEVPFGITEHRESTLYAPEWTPRFKSIKKAVQQASFRFGVSSNFARELSTKYEAEFEVSTLPVPESFYQVPLVPKSQGHTSFVHISSLERRKRVEETILAVKDTRAQGYSVSLDIFGGSDERIAEVREFVFAQQADEYVDVRGRVGREELPRILAGFDVLVLVSSIETAGMVFAEAGAVGLPIIASASLGGSYMVEEDTGVLVPVDDHVALVDAMESFASGAVVKDPEIIRAKSYKRFSGQAYSKIQKTAYDAAVSGMA